MYPHTNMCSVRRFLKLLAFPGDNMQLANPDANPFALLMTPDAVFAELEKSDCLRTLVRRVCKPLDEREAMQGSPDIRTLAAVTDRRSDDRI